MNHARYSQNAKNTVQSINLDVYEFTSFVKLTLDLIIKIWAAVAQR